MLLPCPFVPPACLPGPLPSHARALPPPGPLDLLTPPSSPANTHTQVDPHYQRTVMVCSKFDNRLKVGGLGGCWPRSRLPPHALLTHPPICHPV